MIAGTKPPSTVLFIGYWGLIANLHWILKSGCQGRARLLPAPWRKGHHGSEIVETFLVIQSHHIFSFFFLFFFLIYTAQGSPFRCKKLSVINGSPERNNVLKLCIHMHYTNTNNNIDRISRIISRTIMTTLQKDSPHRDVIQRQPPSLLATIPEIHAHRVLRKSDPCGRASRSRPPPLCLASGLTALPFDPKSLLSNALAS